MVKELNLDEIRWIRNQTLVGLSVLIFLVIARNNVLVVENS